MPKPRIFTDDDFVDEPSTGGRIFTDDDFVDERPAIELEDPGRRSPGETWGYTVAGHEPRAGKIEPVLGLTERRGQRIAPTYKASIDVVAPPLNEPVTDADIPPGMRQATRELIDNPKNRLLQRRTETGRPLAQTEVPDTLQRAAGTQQADPGWLQNMLAEAGPGTVGALEFFDERNPAKYATESARRMTSPLRMGSTPSEEETPTIGDVLDVATLGIPGALSKGGFRKWANETGAGQAVNRVGGLASGLTNTLMEGPRELVAPNPDEDAIASALKAPLRAGTAVADTLTDPVMLALGAAGISPATRAAGVLADAAFGLDMAHKFSGETAERLGEAIGDQGALRGILQEGPAAATEAAFVGTMGKHGREKIRREVNLHGATKEYQSAIEKAEARQGHVAEGKALADLEAKLQARADELGKKGDAVTPEEREALAAENEKLKAARASHDSAELPAISLKDTYWLERANEGRPPQLGEDRQAWKTGVDLQRKPGRRLGASADELFNLVSNMPDAENPLKQGYSIKFHDSALDPDYWAALLEAEEYHKSESAAIMRRGQERGQDASAWVQEPALVTDDGVVHVLAPRIVSAADLAQLLDHERLHAAFSAAKNTKIPQEIFGKRPEVMAEALAKSKRAGPILETYRGLAGDSPRTAQEILAHAAEGGEGRYGADFLDYATAKIRDFMRGNKYLGRAIKDVSDAEIRVMLDRASKIRGKGGEATKGPRVAPENLVEQILTQMDQRPEVASDLLDRVFANEERSNAEAAERARAVRAEQEQAMTSAEAEGVRRAAENMTPEQIGAAVLENKPLDTSREFPEPRAVPPGVEGPPRLPPETVRDRVAAIEQTAETRAKEQVRAAREEEARGKAAAEARAAQEAARAKAEAEAKAAAEEADYQKRLEARVAGEQEQQRYPEANAVFEEDRRREEEAETRRRLNEARREIPTFPGEELPIRQAPGKAPKPSPSGSSAPAAGPAAKAPPGKPAGKKTRYSIRTSLGEEGRVRDMEDVSLPREKERARESKDFWVTYAVPKREEGWSAAGRASLKMAFDSLRSAGVKAKRRLEGVDQNGIGGYDDAGERVVITTWQEGPKRGQPEYAYAVSPNGAVGWAYRFGVDPNVIAGKREAKPPDLGRLLEKTDPMHPYRVAQGELARLGVRRDPTTDAISSAGVDTAELLAPSKTQEALFREWKDDPSQIEGRVRFEDTDHAPLSRGEIAKGLEDLRTGDFWTREAHAINMYALDIERSELSQRVPGAKIRTSEDVYGSRPGERPLLADRGQAVPPAGLGRGGVPEGERGRPGEGQGAVPQDGGRGLGSREVRGNAGRVEPAPFPQANEPPPPAKTEFSMVGASAAEADRRALREAQQRTRRGEDVEDVRQKTGWHKGVDGRWRFEISDHDAELLPAYRRIPYVTSPTKQDGVPLGSILKHDELFRQYPELRDVRVVNISRNSGGTVASFDPRGKLMRLYPQIDVYEQGPLSAIIHEVQHAIQTKEGFAKGGNAETVVNVVPLPDKKQVAEGRAAELEKSASELESRIPEAERLANALDDMEPIVSRLRSGYLGVHEEMRLHEERRKKQAEWAGGEDVPPSFLRDLKQAIEWRKTGTDVRNAIDSLRARATAMREDAAKARALTGKELDDLVERHGDTHGFYQRLAGEAESRQTQKRLKMTPEERAARSPLVDFDVPPEKQIIDRTRYSRRAPEAAVEEGPALTKEDRDAIATIWRYQTQTLGLSRERAAAHLSPRLGDWVSGLSARIRPAKTAPSVSAYRTALGAIGRSGLYQRLQDAGLVKRTGLKLQPESLSEGEPATPIPPMESAQGNLSRSLQRPAEAGEPKNQTIRVELPGGGVRYFGKMTPEQWLEQNVKGVQPDELAARRAWYGKVRDELIPWLSKHFGEDRAAPMVAAWLAANQRESPSGAMRNVMRALDKLHGFDDVDKKAGLGESGVMAILTGDYGKASLGVKLSDFVDSALARTVRRWMGDDPRGGAPAVIDVHSARDAGFVDPVVQKRLAEILGKEKADALQIDSVGAPSELQYEWGARFLRDVTDYLNKKGIEGGNWTPDEVQAVGWFGAAEAMGSRPEHSRQIVEGNISGVSADVAPGEGLGFEKRYPGFYELPYETQEKITQHFVDKALPVLAKKANVAIDKVSVAPGGWMGYPSTATVQARVFGSPEGRLRFAETLRDAAQQQAVYVARPLKSGNRWAVDIVVPKAAGPEVIRKLYDETRAALGEDSDLVQGFSVIDDGTIRMIDPMNGDRGWSTKDYNAIEAAVTKASEVAGVEVHPRRTRLDFREVRAGSAEPGRVQDSGSAPGVGDLQGGRALPDHVQLVRDVLDEAWDLHAPGKRTNFSRRLEPRDVPLEVPQVRSEMDRLNEAESRAFDTDVTYRSKPLKREQPRSWESLNPAIREKHAEWDDEKLVSIANRKGRVLNDVEMAVARDRAEERRLQMLEAGKARTEAAAMSEVDRKAKGLDLDRLDRDELDATLAYIAVQRASVNAGTEAARALAVRRRLAEGLPGPGHEALVVKLIKEFPGATNEKVQEVYRLYKEGRQREFADAIRDMNRPTWAQKFMEYWKGGLLSGLGTHVANFAGNTVEPTARVAETLAAAGIDKVWSGITGQKRERFAGEARHEIMGQVDALPEALRRLAEDMSNQIIHQNEPLANTSRKFEHQVGAIGGRLGTAVRTPFRALGISDDFFKALGFEASLRKRAYREALREGFKGNDADVRASRIADEVRSLSDGERWRQLRADVTQEMLERVFQEDPVKAVQWLAQLTHQHPLAGLVFPFVKTPSNITRVAWQRTPLAPFLPGKVHDVIRKYRAQQAALKAGKEIPAGEKMVSRGDVEDALARPAVGMAIATAFGTMAAAGMMTGSGPVDREENKALRATGWQPYSFHIGDTYIPYNRFEPVASLLQIVADGFEARDERRVTDKVLTSVANSFTNKTFFNALNQVANAITDPNRSAKGTAASYASSLAVPTIVAKGAEAIDPLFRERRSSVGLEGTKEAVARGIGRRVPGYSLGMEPIYTPLGEPAERPGNALTRFTLPVQPSSTRPGTELESYLVKIHAVPNDIPRELVIPQALLPRGGTRPLGGTRISLTDEERAFLAQSRREAAAQLRRQLDSLQRLPVEAQRDRVDDLFRRAYRRSVDQLWVRNQKLRERAKERIKNQL